MRSTGRRSVPVLVSVALVLGIIAAVTPGSRAQVAGTRVDLGVLTATAARQPVHSRWLRVRISEVVSQLDALCYQPALARRAGLVGELQVRANLARTGRLTGVAVTRARGGTLTPALASCVRSAFTRARLDPSALAVTPPLEPGDLGGYVEERPQVPPDVRYPVRVSFALALSAPPAPPADPAPPAPVPTVRACGPNPAGCVSTGCPSRMHCDTNVGCRPSGCGCDTDTGRWTCTSDCGGGTCVREAPVGPPLP